jgi:hypothetical protein
LVKQLHFFALIVSTQLLNALLITLSTQIASPEKELRNLFIICFFQVSICSIIFRLQILMEKFVASNCELAQEEMFEEHIILWLKLRSVL